MSKYFIEGDTLTDIADAIRLKRDAVDEITPEDMPLEISLIDGGGGGLELIASADFELTADCTATSATNLLTFSDVNFVGIPRNERLLISIDFLDTPTESVQFLRKEMIVSSNYGIVAADGVVTKTNGTQTSGVGSSYGLTCTISTNGSIAIKGRYNSSVTGDIKAGHYRLSAFKL